jgi:hypothetical protein
MADRKWRQVMSRHAMDKSRRASAEHETVHGSKKERDKRNLLRALCTWAKDADAYEPKRRKEFDAHGGSNMKSSGKEQHEGGVVAPFD